MTETKPLAERVREFLEFRMHAVRNQAKHEDSDGYFGFISGAQWERARTAKLDELWPEVISFLADYTEECDCGDCYVCDAAALLAKLELAVEGK